MGEQRARDLCSHGSSSKETRRDVHGSKVRSCFEGLLALAQLRRKGGWPRRGRHAEHEHERARQSELNASTEQGAREEQAQSCPGPIALNPALFPWSANRQLKLEINNIEAVDAKLNPVGNVTRANDV